MKSAEIREAFLRFFEEQGHTRVASSSLIPGNDPTLLFTNAGMNQFKDCFLGQEKRAYTRAVSSQKCVRAGGKHNDLENVGYTARHHTFFEMLGNFSFGDYFKRDAITYAWTFLTSELWLNLPKEKLWVTVYASDDEAYDIWTKEIGVPAERMVRIGDNKGAPYASDNFWTMGDTGPCGPCTEIFYDHGADIWGGPPGSPEEDGDRYIEIWNNVFMQFNRTADGVLHPLPAPSVDTGMGLERVSAVLQHVNSNYEIDLFQSLLEASASAIGCANQGQASLKVVADHIRSCGFLIADGVLPSNEGRGYVLRRIIRRACRHGNKLGAQGSFFYQIVAALVAEMGDAFPELKSQQAHIERVLKAEEEQFAKTLEQGLKILEQDLAELKGSVVPGDVVFKLYDTYGFPMDLTGDIARERELTLDEGRLRARNECAARTRPFRQLVRHGLQQPDQGRCTHRVPGLRRQSRQWQGHCAVQGRCRGRRIERGRGGRDHPRPDAVLRRIRWPGR
ncbi:alanine--tRNA ligase [Pseudomonas sp. PvP001]